jgi:hsp70-interacting protein
MDAEQEQLDSLLRWSILNSDPEKLAALAEAAKGVGAAEGDGGMPRVSLAELRQRQARVTEAMDYLKALPTEAELVRLAVSRLQANATGGSVDGAAVEEALQLLLELCDSIDVANDLHTLGALQPVLAQLEGGGARARALAAHVRGTGAANNPPFGAQVAALGGVPALLGRLRADTGDARGKALFALAALVRAAGPARDAFLEAEGLPAVRAAMAEKAAPLALRRKALVLLTDLAGAELAGASVWGLPPMEAAAALTALLHAAADSADLDLAEKALAGTAALAAAPGGGSALRAVKAWQPVEALRAVMEAETEADIGYLLELRGRRDDVAIALQQAAAMGANSTGGAVHDEL